MTNFEYYKTREKAFEAYSKIEAVCNIHDGTSAGRFIGWLFDEYKPDDTLIAHTPIFDLVRMPEVEAGFRPVKIVSKDWVTVIAEKDGKYLMVNQLRYGLNKSFDEFPCGIVEEGEDPMNAAVREFREETGFIVSAYKLKFLGKYAANPAFMSNYMHYYYINLDTVEYDVVQTEFDEHEHLIQKWIDKNDAFTNFIMNNGSSIMGCAWMLIKKNEAV